jgi:predicted nucleotidyltransferase
LLWGSVKQRGRKFNGFRQVKGSANERRQGHYGLELSHNGDMVTLDTLRAERREEILRLAARHGAHNLRVFGSVARGEANESSDLDLLVAWEPGRSLLDHAGLVQDLQQLLGVKVHVGTGKSLHGYVRDRILREATGL